jgi:LPPG:FO 2-phospho-L-lactate transferase
MKTVLIAGGVGGARLAAGLSRVLKPEDLTVVVNVGDDFTHLGMRICPDVDTVTYTLAGIENRVTGWGIAGDTFRVLDALAGLHGPAWFRLGDCDIATHLYRTNLLAEGLRLTEVTDRIRRSLGVPATVLPATDDPVPTRVITDAGELDFQDYFVARHCEPRVTGVVFAGIEDARLSPEVFEAMSQADGVMIAPSNPFVSVEPILAVAGMRDLVARKPVVAVSPIVGGAAIKGPAGKMMQELGLEVSPAGVARRYAGLVDGFLMDDVDAVLTPAVRAMGVEVRTAQSIMRTDADREHLARACLDFLSDVGELRPLGE